MGATVVSILLAGCTNESIMNIRHSDGKFTLEVVQGGSRTELDSEFNTVWSNDDKIYVTSIDEKVTGVLSYKGGNKFSGYVLGGDVSDLNHVIFPVPEDGKVKLNQPKGDRLNLPMFGEISGASATLKNVCALVNLPVEGASSINLTSNGDNTLNGHYEYQNGEFVFIPGQGGISVSVNEEGKAFFAVSTDIEGIEHSGVKLKVNGSEEAITIPVKEGAISNNNVPEIEVNEDGQMEKAVMNVTTPEILEMALNRYDEVKLAGDITIEEGIVIAADKQMTLDLNGFALAGNINNSGTLTVVNTKIDLKSVSSFTVNGGTTLIQGGIYDSNVNAAGGFSVKNVDERYIVLPKDAVIVADIDGFKQALKSNTTVSLILIAKNIEITEDWNGKDHQISVPVLIEGAGNVLKFTGDIDDNNNYNSALRIIADAEIRNLTFDLSEARKSGINMRAISATGNLVVTNCSFIGNESETKTRGIIFGEGAKIFEDVEIEICGCSFINWGYGVTDNENGKDVKSVYIDGNTFENAGVQVSAYEQIVFIGNAMKASSLTITSYTDAENAEVKVLDNTLDLNKKNQIGTSKHTFNLANIESQEGVDIYAE